MTTLENSLVHAFRAVLILAFVATGPARAETAAEANYPNKPIRFVVGFSAGGTTDTIARVVGARLAEIFGQKVVVENRPGAGGRIASEHVAKARPDGATVLFASAGFAIDAALYKNLAFDPIDSFAPISMLAAAPYVVVVHPSVPARNIAELIELAKRSPGKLNNASAGPGSTLDLAFRLFRSKAGVDIVRVAYQGANGITDLLAGRVQLSFAGLPQTSAFIKNGQLRALAVTTPMRSEMAKDLPTIAESGLPGYEVTSWYGALVPAGTAPGIVAKLSRGIGQALGDTKVQARMKSEGIEPRGTNPEEFSGTIKSEIAQWKKVAAETGITAE